MSSKWSQTVCVEILVATPICELFHQSFFLSALRPA